MQIRLITCLLITFFNSHHLYSDSNGSVLPEIKKISDGVFEFGGVKIEKSKKAVSIPAISNQINGLVEYGLVHEDGKIHESLFRTKISPQVFHTSLLLLKFEPVNSFFDNLWSENPKEIDYSDHCFDIVVFWELNGTNYRSSIEELSINQTRKSSVTQKSFIFTGSRMVEGTFIAESTGSILAIYADDNAILNNSHYDSTNDDVWIANKKKMPPLEFPVSIRFHLPQKMN